MDPSNCIMFKCIISFGIASFGLCQEFKCLLLLLSHLPPSSPGEMEITPPQNMKNRNESPWWPGMLLKILLLCPQCSASSSLNHRCRLSLKHVFIMNQRLGLLKRHESGRMLRLVVLLQTELGRSDASCLFPLVRPSVWSHICDLVFAAFSFRSSFYWSLCDRGWGWGAVEVGVDGWNSFTWALSYLLLQIFISRALTDHRCVCRLQQRL